MRPTLLVHGGAGSMKSMSDPREVKYRAAMREATAVGAAVLMDGGSALDAVVAVNVHMENSGVFNAGLGSGLTADGRVEMDAAVMEGTNLGYGAVAAIEGVANPVALARRVMEDTPHCFLVGTGAEEFARKCGLGFREDFPNASRRAEWERRKAQMEVKAAEESASLADQLAALGGVLGDAGADADSDTPVDAPVGQADTVGAVAIDADGRTAAAVTTGGIWMKMPGRVGDSPLIGAGLYAVDGEGATCATGTGETILRVMLCRDVVERMRAGASAVEASIGGVALLESRFGARMAGVITIAADGTPAYAFHTRGMGRAVWRDGMREPAAAVWPGEDWDRAVPG